MERVYELIGNAEPIGFHTITNDIEKVAVKCPKCKEVQPLFEDPACIPEVAGWVEEDRECCDCDYVFTVSYCIRVVVHVKQ